MPTEQRDPREPKTLRIRRTDICKSGNETMTKEFCPATDDLHVRVAALERDNTLLKSGFVLNDLNLPDFDGHRSDHRVRKEAAKIMESYKITATHKVIAAIVAALVLFFSAGITTKLQAIVQTKETK